MFAVWSKATLKIVAFVKRFLSFLGRCAFLSYPESQHKVKIITNTADIQYISGYKTPPFVSNLISHNYI